MLAFLPFLNGQETELKLIKRFGNPKNYNNDEWTDQSYSLYEENKMTIPNGFKNAHRLRATSENSYLLLINKELYPKWNIYGTIGLEYARTHYEKKQYFYRRLNDILIHNDRLSFHFGAFKRFSFFNDRLFLDLGGEIQKRMYFQKIKHAEKDNIIRGDFINHASEITTYRNGSYGENGYKAHNILNNFFLELNTNISFAINNELFVNLGFDYNRNNTLYYDYFAVGFYRENIGGQNNTTIYRKDPYEGPNGQKEKVRSHFKYFTIGLTYKF